MLIKRKFGVSNEIKDLIRSLHPNLKWKIRAALSEIQEDPNRGKQLKFELKELKSFKVGKFRIIYKEKSKIIDIIAIGPRRSIYEETFKLIKKGNK